MNFFNEHDQWEVGNTHSADGNVNAFGDRPNDEMKNDDLAEIATVSKTRQRKKQGPRRGQLTAEMLVGERGLPALMETFADVKFRGKRHALEDLNMMMSKLEYWAHRLCPSAPFDEVLEKIEALSSKRPIKTFLAKMRYGDSFKEDGGSEEKDAVLSTTNLEQHASVEDECIQAESSGHCTVEASQTILTDEQRQRIAANRKKAEELRAMGNVKKPETDDFDDIDFALIDDDY